MTYQIALIELLERIGANNGAPLFISNHALNEWPVDVVIAMKACELIIQASSAQNIICPGCERSCSMPVHLYTHQTNTIAAFVFCDKRNDISRVPISLDYIKRWQTSGYFLAKLISKLLELPLPTINATNSSRWEIGVFRGAKHSSHLILAADTDAKLFIQAAGHKLVLDELLSFASNTIKIDRLKIIRAVDNPIIGGGDVESAAERRKRLKKRVAELKSKKIKGFLKRTAEEESISVSRLKQILDDNKKI